MGKLIIGIDPDITASGVAVSVGGQISKLWCLNLFDLVEYFKANKEGIKCVYLEAGWLIKKSSWHESKNKNTAEKVAYKVGHNHQIGMCIEHFLINLGIKYRLIKPTQKKLNHADFCIYSKWDKAIPTNQEKRDAGCLVIGIK